jgi:hypothetical protein
LVKELGVMRFSRLSATVSRAAVGNGRARGIAQVSADHHESFLLSHCRFDVDSPTAPRGLETDDLYLIKSRLRRPRSHPMAYRSCVRSRKYPWIEPATTCHIWLDSECGRSPARLDRGWRRLLTTWSPVGKFDCVPDDPARNQRSWAGEASRWQRAKACWLRSSANQFSFEECGRNLHLVTRWHALRVS